MSAGRKHPPAWFTRWYFRHLIATDRCPCGLAGRSKLLQRSGLWARLVHLCARMDDEYDRLHLIDCAGWVLGGMNTTANATNVSVTWSWKRTHGGSVGGGTPRP